MDLANRRPAMPWREVSVMEQRREFVRLAMQEGANRRELCRRFGIHPQTGYKWLARWQPARTLPTSHAVRVRAPGRRRARSSSRLLRYATPIRPGELARLRGVWNAM